MPKTVYVASCVRTAIVQASKKSATDIFTATSSLGHMCGSPKQDRSQRSRQYGETKNMDMNRDTHLSSDTHGGPVSILKNFPILAKLLIAFGLVLAVCTVISVFALLQLHSLEQDLKELKAGVTSLQQRGHLIEGASAAFWILISSLGAGAAGVVLSSVFIKIAVVRPIQAARNAALRIAGRDLTGPIVIDSTDETGALSVALSSMQRSLKASMSDICVATDSIHTAIHEIAEGTLDLAARTEKSASSLQQTSCTMQSLTNMVYANKRAAGEASLLASSATSVASRGEETVNRVVITMGDIHAASMRIAEITSVIDGIAFQTNILALNAAVEAARAGEKGRGFAVVASEVRTLAQRSADAAKEIRGLINSSVEKVEVGSKQVAEAGNTMVDILNSVKRVAEIVGDIDASSGPQAEGISELSLAVQYVDEMTQQNAALVEQSAAATESLQDQAARLTSIVRTFKLKS